MDVKALKTEISKIHYDKSAKGWLFSFLCFCSKFYGYCAELKNYLYDTEKLKPKRVNAFVISVGNLTTGGVGKTPVVAEIAKYLKSKNKKVAIVSRGYGGKLSNKNINVISDGEKIYYGAKLAGDEPYWLAKMTGCVVITSKNRYEASKFAVENFGINYIILDDGFQHRKLHRDLDIILVDSVKKFGNEHLLPAGPLRENVKSVKRADKIIVVSKNTEHSEAEDYVLNLKKIYDKDVYLCKIEPDIVYNISTGEKLGEKSKITAVCAIGQPEQFYNFLKNYELDATVTFDDHHIYVEDDLKNIKGCIVTTEKDAVKMKSFGLDNIFALRLKCDVEIEEIIK